MEYQDAISLVTAAIERTIFDRNSNAECPHGRGAHKVKVCSNAIYNGLLKYVEQSDEITPDELGMEFLRLAKDG